MRMTPLRWVSALLLGIALPALLVAPVPSYQYEDRLRDEYGTWRNDDYSAAVNIRIASQRSSRLRNRYFAERAASLAKEPVIIGAGSSRSIVKDARVELVKHPRFNNEAPFDSVVGILAQKVDEIHTRTAVGSRGDVRTVLRTFPQIDAATLAAPANMPFLNTTQPWAVMPPAIDGHTCMALYPVGSLHQNEYHHSTLVGPCFPYAAFGLPGRGMLQLLTEIKYQGGQYFPWSAGLPKGPSPVKRLPAFLRELDVLQRGEYTLGGTVNPLPCIAYGGSFCEQMVADNYSDGVRNRRSFGNPNVVPIRGSYFDSFLDLGVLYRELGPEQFALLWRSDKPVFATFAEVTGMTVGEFDRALLLKAVGPYHPGPWPTGTTILTLVALCLIATGIAAQFGTRPQVA